MSLTIGSLFSGIGGLEMGLEWAGLGEVRWQVEQSEFCRGVLAKHWPHAVRYDDVCKVGAHNLARVDIICGGFPCQDISIAGKGGGLAGARSGLWFEYARIVREIRPRFVVVENVSALRGRGLGTVLGDLASAGYDAEWRCVRAADVGAPHRRERLFIVAHANGQRESQLRGGEPHERGRASDGREASREPSVSLADADRTRQQGHGGAVGVQAPEPRTDGARDEGVWPERAIAQPRLGRGVDGLPDRVDCWPSRPSAAQYSWEPPRLCTRGVKHGARLKALGNAVVPQVSRLVGGMVWDVIIGQDAQEGTT